MKHITHQILYNPITIFILLLIAFLMASVPARAGGIPENLQGEGGAPFVDSTTVKGSDDFQESGQEPMVMDTDISVERGIVLSVQDNEISLLTLRGQRNFVLHEDAVIKQNGRIVSIDNLQRGDIISMNTTRQGTVMSMNKLPGLFGNVAGLLLALGFAGITALATTQAYTKWHEVMRPHHTTKRYVLH